MYKAMEEAGEILQVSDLISLNNHIGCWNSSELNDTNPSITFHSLKVLILY
jgi:hypothetical protein